MLYIYSVVPLMRQIGQMIHPKLLEQKRLERSKQLKEYRESIGINISQLAAYSGLNRNTIYQIEGGYPWTVDSEIIYVVTLEKLKKQ